MSKKIILYIAFGLALILFGKFLYLQLEDYCPRCKKPVVPNEVLKITNDYKNLTIIYSKNNGSLPPVYHREDIFTVTTNEKGNSTGEYAIKDYKKILEKKPFTISHEQLSKLLRIAARIDPKSNDSVNAGCTGGSVKSISISQNKKVLLETSTYNCSGKATNESLEKFSDEVEGVLLK